MMQYYYDGAHDLIRVHAPDDITGPALTEAPAQRYQGTEYGWIESRQYSLPIVALYSGDYYPVDEAQAVEIMAKVDAEAARIARNSHGRT